MLIFCIHFCLLASLSYYISKRICKDFWEKVLGSYILLWTNIVVTSLILSGFSKLGDSVLYFRLSICLAMVSAYSFRKIAVPLYEESHVSSASSSCHHFKRTGEVFLYATLLIVLGFNILIGMKYSPNNWDALTYHLPRIYFYLSQGNLSHFETLNLRQIFFPFNGTLFQMFLMIYGQSDKLINAFNLISWALAFIATYVLSRRCGIGHIPSLLAAWIGVMAQQVLAQATSTTNDVQAAVPVLIGIIFTMKWWKERRRSFAVLSGISFGLALGTKLTTLFFLPMTLGMAFFWIVRSFWGEKQFPLGRRERGHLMLALLVIVVLAAPFMGINYYYTKQISTTHYNYLLNKPFSLFSSIQTSYTYFMQLLLDPIQHMAVLPKQSALFRAAAEPALKKIFFSNWNRGYAVNDLHIFAPDLSENEVFFGFAVILVIAALIRASLKPDMRNHSAFWLALIAVGWFITYCASAKWSLFNQRYFISAFLISLPLVGLLFENAQKKGRLTRIWVNSLFGFIIITSLVFGYSYLFYNSLRNVKAISQPGFTRGRIPIPQPLEDVVLNRSDIKFVYSGYTHEDERLYQFISYGRDKRFSIGQRYDDNRYNILSFWRPITKSMYANIPSSSAYTLLQIPNKRSPGITELGSFGEGTDKYYYYGFPGRQLHEPASEKNAYIIVRTLFDRFGGQGKPLEERLQSMQLDVEGLNDEDGVVLRIYYTDISGENKLLLETTHDSSSQITIPEHYQRLYLEARDTASNILQSTSEILVTQYISERNGDRTPEDYPFNFAFNLITEKEHAGVKLEGMGPLEGPYPQWSLPQVRWATSSKVKIEFNSVTEKQSSDVCLSMSFRPQVRKRAIMTVRFNGEKLKTYALSEAYQWTDVTLNLPQSAKNNILELTFESVKGGDAKPADSLQMLFRAFLFHLKSNENL